MPEASRVDSEIREFGLSHADLARILPRLDPSAELLIQGRDYVFKWPGAREIKLTVGPEQARRIAGLAIPYVQITFSYDGVDGASRNAFTQRFERCFQKGGG